MSAVRTAVAVALLALSCAAQFVVPEGSDFHNGSALPQLDDGSDEDELRALQDALQQGSIGAALDVLRLLRADRDVALVPYGPRTHVPALDRAAQMVAASDSTEVREAVEQDARRAIDAARERRDVEALVDWATRGRALAASSRAAALAARLLYESGHWWGAASMVALVDEPDADLVELGERARRRADEADGRDAADEPDGELDVFDWRWAVGVRHAGDVEPEVGPPLVVDGRPGELLIVDGQGLHGFDPVAQERTMASFRWNDQVLRTMRERRFVTTLPAPREFSAARAGSRLVVPFNVPESINRSRSSRVDRSAHLVAVDLQARGRVDVVTASLAWITEPPRGRRDAAFGPPLVRGRRVFALVYRVGLQTEVSLACFDLDTGAPLWETPLVLGTDVPRFGNRQAEMSSLRLDKRARTAQLAERDGVIHASTGYGVVAAVDGWTGVVRHSFRYDRLFTIDPKSYHAAYLFDPHPPGWRDEPVRLWDDRVVVAPSDSRYLYVLADEPGPRGHLILDDPIERLDRVHVVDLVPDPGGSASPAILATQRRDRRLALVLLSPDGHVLRRSTPLGVTDSRTFDDARPLRIGDDVLVPTVTGVHAFDLTEDGAAPRRLSGPLLGGPLPTLRLMRVDAGLVALTPQGEQPGLLVQVWLEP